MSLTGGLIIKSGRPTLPHFRLMPIATLDQLNPVQNQWYEVLRASDGIIYFARGQEDVNGQDWEMRITLDNVVLTGAAPLPTQTRWHSAYVRPTPDVDDSPIGLTVVDELADDVYPIMFTNTGLYGQSILVEMRITDALVAGSILQGRVTYGIL
jgi:hypothetical protein